MVHSLHHPAHETTIGIVGKYVNLRESYKSLNEALLHAGMHTLSKVNIRYIDSEASPMSRPLLAKAGFEVITQVTVHTYSGGR